MNTPISLNDRHHALISFFILNNADPLKLKDHFNLTARELIDFLISPAIKEALQSIAATLKAATACIAATAAQAASQAAMKHLQDVCDTLSKKPEEANRLRMAATSLGSLARAAGAPHQRSAALRPAAEPERPSSLSASSQETQPQVGDANREPAEGSWSGVPIHVAHSAALLTPDAYGPHVTKSDRKSR